MTPILVVSLPNSPKRKDIKNELDRQNLTFSWVDGILIENINDIPEEDYSDMECYGVDRLKNDPRYITRAVGCKRAMEKAIKTASKYNSEWVIILQDDFRIINNFKRQFDDYISNINENDGILLLHRSGGEFEPINGNPSVELLTTECRSMAAFAVRPKICEAILEELTKFKGEDDRIWKKLREIGMNVLASSKLLGENDQFQSDIIRGIPELKMLWHSDGDNNQFKSVYTGFHAYWKDKLTFHGDGTFKRNNTNCEGVWEIDKDKNLWIRWNDWGDEMLKYENDKEYHGSGTKLILDIGESPIHNTNISDQKDFITIDLGPERTGNNLFQIATTYAHALKYNYDCYVPFYNTKHANDLYQLIKQDIDGKIYNGGYGVDVKYEERYFSYIKLPRNIKNCSIRGYFQSEKYFKEYEMEIKNIFRSLKDIKKKDFAGIHIRMGDYLDNPDYYQVIDDGFITKSLSMLSDNIKTLVIFSDEPERAFKMVSENPNSHRFSIMVDRNDTLQALKNLTSMEELILSNSTFSWWGAWLGEQENVIIRSEWFKGYISDYKDVYCEGWKKV